MISPLMYVLIYSAVVYLSYPSYLIYPEDSNPYTYIIILGAIALSLLFGGAIIYFALWRADSFTTRVAPWRTIDYTKQLIITFESEETITFDDVDDNGWRNGSGTDNGKNLSKTSHYQIVGPVSYKNKHYLNGQIWREHRLAILIGRGSQENRQHITRHNVTSVTNS